MNREQIASKLRTLTVAAAEDPYIPTVAATFLELCKLADFDAEPSLADALVEEDPASSAQRGDSVPGRRQFTTGLGFSYTINLNLPATTEIEVFNAIFKSLKENLLDGQ